ncbi:MAG: hypothetical protein FWE34_01615 [Defluviitaleaceae bacterium]|nr:hypothetical protein [Defluviitaleaceae bacterium]
MRVYEQNPATEYMLCPKIKTTGNNANNAVQPLSGCMGCPHHSFMTCHAPSGAFAAKNYRSKTSTDRL